MHVICFVNLPWSATARLRKVSLQLSYLSVFSLIKRVFRDALNNVKKAEETAFEAFGKEKSSAENWEDSIETDISDTDTVEQEKPEQKPMSSNNMYLIIGIAVILCIGGAGFFIMKKKPAKKNNVVMEDDEDINFYDNDEEFNEDNE